MSSSKPVAVICLAAGAGTRMKSELPKVMHSLSGRSMVHHALHAAHDTGTEHIAAVVRHQRDKVAEHISELPFTVVLADQDDIPGTGRAVECGLDALPKDLHGTIVVTYGDVPLLTAQTLLELTAAHEAAGNGTTIVTAKLDDPTGYGRIVRSESGDVVNIVEHKDAMASDNSLELLAIEEVNSGIYAFDAAVLRELLPSISTDNAQKEKYLTDMVDMTIQSGRTVGAFVVTDVAQTEGVNNRVQLATLAKEMNRRICEAHMMGGATIVDPGSTWIDVDVTISTDVTIHPGCQLRGATSIAAGAEIGPDSTLLNMAIGERASVIRCHGRDSVVGADTNVGPFAYIRPETNLADGGKIGTFVETKKATIGRGSKVPHLSYVGDATIGEGTNIGAGTIFCNYDGVKKNHTTIGNQCRTGSGNLFVAPISIGDGAYTGAGTNVRKDVPPGALSITVSEQRIMEGWVVTKRPGSDAAEAATRANEEAK